MLIKDEIKKSEEYLEQLLKKYMNQRNSGIVFKNDDLLPAMIRGGFDRIKKLKEFAINRNKNGTSRQGDTQTFS